MTNTLSAKSGIYLAWFRHFYSFYYLTFLPEQRKKKNNICQNYSKMSIGTDCQLEFLYSIRFRYFGQKNDQSVHSIF